MRCFVAVELPDEVRTRVTHLQDELRAAAPAADVRWTPPAQMHLTLRFLGEVAEDRRDALVQALAAAVPSAPIRVVAEGAGAFPTARRPRVVWAGVGEGGAALGALASSVDEALARLGIPPEGRPFRPHVTLGRVRAPGGLGHMAATLEARREVPLGAWQVRSVVLYRSRLNPAGAVHEALAHVPLAPRDT